MDKINFDDEELKYEEFVEDGFEELNRSQSFSAN